MINLKDAQERMRARKTIITHASEFNHLRDHSGFRSGYLHVLIGRKGGGKSSLLRSWIGENAYNDQRVYIRASEQGHQEYEDDIVVNLGRVRNVDGLDNLRVDSEKELDRDELGEHYFDLLEMRLREFGATIFFLDNFTTSVLSDCAEMKQGQNAKKLVDLAEKLDIPIVVATHTVRGFRGSTIANGDDARGSGTLANTAPYIYSINVFFELPGSPTVLFIDKARHHPESNKALYLLQYDKRVELFVKDERMSRPQLAELLAPLVKSKGR